MYQRVCVLGLTIVLLVFVLGGRPAQPQTTYTGPDSAVSTERMKEGRARFDQALALYHQGRYKEALPLAREALEVWEKEAAPNDPLLAAGLTLLARLYDEAGLYAEAAPLYLRVLSIDRHNYGLESKEVAGDLNNLAALYYKQSDLARAEPLFKQALAIRVKILGPDHPDTATTQNNLGALYEAKGDFAQAEAMYRGALAVREKVLGPEDPKVATTLNNLAALFETTGRYEEAEPLYLRALSLKEKARGPAHPETAAAVNNLALLYDSMGWFDRAEPLYRRALAAREKVLGPDHPDTAVSLNNLAEFYAEFGQYDQALPLHQRALAVREKAWGPYHPDVAQSLNNLALLYQNLGDYAKADKMLNQALLVWDKTLGPDHPETAAALNNLAEFYQALGEFKKAEPLLRRSLEIYQQAFGRIHPAVATGWNNLAGLSMAQGDYVQAEPLEKKALSVWQQAVGPEHPSVASALNNLAAIYVALGLYDQARALHQRALALREKLLGADHPDTAQSRSNLAGALYALGDLGGAEKLYRQALQDLETALGPESIFLTPVLNNLAVLAAATGRYQEARALFQRALDLDRKIIDQALGFTSEERKAAFLAGKQKEVFAFLTLTAGPLGQDASARREALDLWLRRKGLVLEAQRRFQEALFYWDIPQAQEKFQELARAKSVLSRLVFSGPGPEGLELYRKRLDQAEARVRELEAELGRISRIFAEQREITAADSRKVAAALPPGSVLLEFARADRINFLANRGRDRWRPAHYLAFVLPAGSADGPALVDLGEAEALERAALEFKALAADPRDQKGEKLKKASARVYESLFAPLRPHLGMAREIFISPDGILNLIPFEAVLGPDGRFLIEDYTFNYLSSGRDVVGFDRPAPVRPGPALLMGDPDFDLAGPDKMEALTRLGLPTSPPGETLLSGVPAPRGLRDQSFVPLAGTRAEVLAVRDVLGSEEAMVHLGAEALEEVLLSQENPRLVHLATHGFFLRDPEPAAPPDEGLMAGDQGRRGAPPALEADNPLRRSGLALAGANQALTQGGDGSHGLLTAEKVLGLRLQGAELVVLSACETGLGEVRNGEGVYGLRRAFTQAGAEAIVMSLWSVPDLETTELMTGFYRNLAGGRKKSEALRAAALAEKETVAGRYGFPHPFYWGAFVFLGRP
ncbi:MAG: tetratricopeptide repeat protein [Thermodesulfobacteriota bacterium]